MSETVLIPGTEIELPWPQVRTLARMTAEHTHSTWHLAECGCCVCLHPDPGSPSGWLIGPDGEAEYIERTHL